MQCEVDRIVFGMKCAPDGATQFIRSFADAGQRVPEVVGGVLEEDCVQTFAQWPQANTHPAYGHAQAILSPYGRQTAN